MSKQLRFSVEGTTCHSCEIFIERECRKIPGVQKVDVSHAEKTIRLHVQEGTSLTAQDLQACLAGSHYHIREWQEPSGKSSWNVRRIGGVVLLVGAVWYVFDQLGFLNLAPSLAADTTRLWTIFLLGIIASFSSCTAILAGFIVALSATHAQHAVHERPLQRLRPHVLFHAGRFLSFGFFGMLIGYAGSLFILSPVLNALFVLVIAVLMLLIGANLLELVPSGAFSLRPPKFLAHRIHALKDSHHPLVPFLLGSLTFFLPCGFTQSVQLYALSTGEPTLSAIIMIVFALGTLPALFGLGAATSLMQGNLLKRMTRIAGIVVLVISVSQIRNGFALLGFSPASFSRDPVVSSQTLAATIDGRQKIQMEVASAGYYAPDVFQVTEDVPVDWEIYGPQFMGCFDTIVSRTLGIQEQLRPGWNTISFTPTKPGLYVFSCSMGMARGTIIVVPAQS